MSTCPFGQPIGSRRDPQWCPLVAKDFRSCHCLIDVLRHGCGGADDQTAFICEWWTNSHAWEYDWPDRVMLPEFEDRGSGDGSSLGGSTPPPGPHVCLICGAPGGILCEDHR